MERLDVLSGGLPIKHPEEKKPNTIRKKNTGKASFFSFLESTGSQAEQPDGVLEFSSLEEEEIAFGAMLDDIHTIGELLKNQPKFNDILRYKKAVQRFLQYVVKRSYAIAEKSSGMSIIKRKRFTIVSVIDQKLEKLAAGILQNQFQQLEVLKRVEEIEGLLVDILQ